MIVVSVDDKLLLGQRKLRELLNHYITHYGAVRLPHTVHPYALAIRGNDAKKIREVYDYVWSDEKL